MTYDKNIEKYVKILQGLQENYTLIVNKIDELKNTFQFQNDKSNDDARLAFYFLASNYSDAAIHLLMFNTYISNKPLELRQYYDEFKISIPNSKAMGRMIPLNKIRWNNCQCLSNLFSISIYSSFESSLRNIMRSVNEDCYVKTQNNIVSMLDHLMSRSENYTLYLTEYHDRFVAFNKIRNSIHNNGVHMPYNKNKNKEDAKQRSEYQILEDETTIIKTGERIRGGDGWDVHLQMTKLLFLIHNDILEIPEVKSKSFIFDPSS